MKNLAYLKKCIRIAGGQRALARKIGATQQHIYNWMTRDKNIPPKYVIPMEKAVNGAVTRQELRPDIYPKE